jgi:hypothetical protein
MTTSKQGERTFASLALLATWAALALAGCSLIAPLEEVDKSPPAGERSTQAPATEPRDGSDGGDSSPPAKKKDAGSAGSDDADGSGGEDDETPPRGNPSRAGRSGGTKSHAGTGGSSTGDSSAAGAGVAGRGAADAGAATDAAASGAADAGSQPGTSDEPACDPTNPQQPRPPLIGCEAGHTCIPHEDQRAADGSVPTTCETAGSAAAGESCTQDADCTPGHFCDTMFHFCVDSCGTSRDCDDPSEQCIPGIPGMQFTIGTSGLTVGICLDTGLIP